MVRETNQAGAHCALDKQTFSIIGLARRGAIATKVIKIPSVGGLGGFSLALGKKRHGTAAIHTTVLAVRKDTKRDDTLKASFGIWCRHVSSLTRGIGTCLLQSSWTAVTKRNMKACSQLSAKLPLRENQTAIPLTSGKSHGRSLQHSWKLELMGFLSQNSGLTANSARLCCSGQKSISNGFSQFLVNLTAKTISGCTTGTPHWTKTEASTLLVLSSYLITHAMAGQATTLARETLMES
mmetsp:Transcript_123015/g.244842  ORF Transcript_123015/g.244842 Transcript_123015/m.244842 type:complete len:238 (+) Transcript_123015:275-988(+)